MFINSYTFNYVFIISISKQQYFFYRLSHLIPIQWQIILLNDGSLTEVLNYLNEKQITFNMFQKNNYAINNNRYLRYIWMEDNIYTKMMFAESLWQFKYINNNKEEDTLKYNIPIGKLIINTKVDIYKKIHEIYYGYSIKLENKLNYHQPIWGRKYTLYYKNQLFITIKEFFSPGIINYFY